ncbi:aquaporin [Macrococcus capreoli]
MLSKMLSNFQKSFGEFIGTYFLVLFGTFSIVVFSKQYLASLAISLTFGLIVMILIYALSHVSGAHFNPAVTIAFYINKEISSQTAVAYIVSQILGGIFASITLKILFPTINNYGQTKPIGGLINASIVETLFTFFLMFVILNCSKNAEIKTFTALAVGAVIFIEALVGGGISGASMNPSRSIGPAIISGDFESLYIYIIFPVLGAMLAVILDKIFKIREI